MCVSAKEMEMGKFPLSEEETLHRGAFTKAQLLCAGKFRNERKFCIVYLYRCFTYRYCTSLRTIWIRAFIFFPLNRKNYYKRVVPYGTIIVVRAYWNGPKLIMHRAGKRHTCLFANVTREGWLWRWTNLIFDAKQTNRPENAHLTKCARRDWKRDERMNGFFQASAANLSKFNPCLCYHLTLKWIHLRHQYPYKLIILTTCIVRTASANISSVVIFTTTKINKYVRNAGFSFFLYK